MRAGEVPAETIVVGRAAWMAGRTTDGAAGATITGLQRVPGEGGAPVAFNGLRNRKVMRSLSPIAS